MVKQLQRSFFSPYLRFSYKSSSSQFSELSKIRDTKHAQNTTYTVYQFWSEQFLSFKSKLKLQPKIQRNVISAALAEWNSIPHIFFSLLPRSSKISIRLKHNIVLHKKYKIKTNIPKYSNHHHRCHCYRYHRRRRRRL